MSMLRRGFRLRCRGFALSFQCPAMGFDLPLHVGHQLVAPLLHQPHQRHHGDVGRQSPARSMSARVIHSMAAHSLLDCTHRSRTNYDTAPAGAARGHANVAREALQNHRFVRPIVGKLRQRFGFTFVDRSLAANREVDPTAATWAATDKTGIGPPRSHKRIVNRPSECFQTKIDRLQTLLARRRADNRPSR